MPENGAASVVTAILGGGQGSRLWPLTRDRAKPAVPFGGRFRLIDIPISNSLHAGFNRIFVLTQFNSASLHRHIARTYRFDTFSRGYVNILAAEQTVTNRDWYQGTADAVRKNLPRLRHGNPSEILVLSGDQLYVMNLGGFVRHHREMHADVSIAVTPVAREDAHSFGIMRVDEDGRIVEFVEKPDVDARLDELTPSAPLLDRLGLVAPEGSLLASMGMYVFAPAVLGDLLHDEAATDFGRQIIPRAIETHPVFAFPYAGYWEDIGTIPAYYRASLRLTRPLPPLNLYDPRRTIYTHPRFLPGTKINHCDVEESILCEGSILSASRVRHSIVGIRAIVRPQSTIDDSIVMGATHYEPSDAEIEGVHLGIGEGCKIHNAIIDLDARIGDGCEIVNREGVEEHDGDNHAIRGGIVVVPRGAILPAGTII